MTPRYKLPRQLIVVLFCGTLVSVNGDITISWDDGYETFTDFSGTSLTSGGANNQNGSLVELGFFTESDDSNLFRGNWIPLTAGTRVGDTSDGTDAGDGAFTFSTKFEDADGDATTFFSSAINTVTGSGGSGYSTAPTVIISRGTGDSSGSGATATATLSGAAIGSLTLVNRGTNYTVDPTITFSGGGGSGASGSADRFDYTDQNTGLRSVSVDSVGTDYTANFDVTFSGGGGSGATGEAIVDGSGGISKIVIRNPGTGYTSLPTVDLSAGAGSSGAGTASYLPKSGQRLAIRFYDGTANTSGTAFNTVAAPTTASGWNAWPTSDTDLNLPILSADSSLTGILFQTDAHSISQDLKTAVTDIDTALTITTTQGSLYTTGNPSGGTLTANIASGTQTFSGVIANGLFEDTTDGLVSLTKTGSGGLTINTLAQTYSGDTTISAGTLTLSGAATIANSNNIYLSTGTTLDVSGLSSTFTLDDGQTLKGTGSVTGDIAFASTLSSGANLQDGSSISPGGDASNYGIGKIAVTGAGTWNAGTTYHWEINDLAGDAGDLNGNNLGWDYLTFTGALAISGSASNKILIDIAALDGNTSPNFNLLGELGVGKTQRPALNREHKPGYDFPIVYADGGITGFNADHFEIDYMHFYEQWDDPFHIWNLSLSGDNKTLSLTYSAVPEPSTYVMVSGLLLLPAVTIYRRLKKKKAKEAVDDSDQGS
jgi:autotransporter-associated beta strand protein